MSMNREPYKTFPNIIVADCFGARTPPSPYCLGAVIISASLKLSFISAFTDHVFDTSTAHHIALPVMHHGLSGKDIISVNDISKEQVGGYSGLFF